MIVGSVKLRLVPLPSITQCRNRRVLCQEVTPIPCNVTCLRHNNRAARSGCVAECAIRISTAEVSVKKLKCFGCCLCIAFCAFMLQGGEDLLESESYT